MIYASNIPEVGSIGKFTLFMPGHSLYYTDTIVAKLRYAAFTCGFDNNLKTITR